MTSLGAINSSKTWRASTSLNVPSYEPGKQRLRFFPSCGTTNAVRARNDGMLTIGTAVIRPASVSRVERVHEAHDGRDRRVLAAVDPAEKAEVRAVAPARGFEARELELGEQLVLEADGAALDHPASRASTSTSGT